MTSESGVESPIVLVVDDEPSVCTATRRLLSSAGYRVRTFESTERLFAHGRPSGPCCVILDLQIPGEDGLQCQQRLNERGIHVPIIFVSGHGDIPKSVLAMKGGAVDFLSKPYDGDKLIALVEKALAHDAKGLAANLHMISMREHF